MRLLEKKIHITSDAVDQRYWKDLWGYRELFYFLAWRDVKVRYKQTIIGLLWVWLRPLLTMVILTVVFSHVAGLGENSTIPYSLIVFAGLLPWQFFASSFAESGNSVVANSQMISKVYFPRMIIPISSVLAGLVDFFVTLILLLPLMLWFGHMPDWHVLFLPVFLLLGLMISLGSGIGLAALNVQYRDVKYVIPFVVQIGLYASPVGFSVMEVPTEWRWLYELNPMVGVIEGFRWSLLGGEYPLASSALVSSLVVGFGVLILSIRYFRRTERTFADVI